MAQYADACNLFAGPELARKLDILQQHCADVGRNYDDIEKTVMMPLDPGPDGENVDAILTQLRSLAELGVTHAHSRVADVSTLKPLDILGAQVIPEAAKF